VQSYSQGSPAATKGKRVNNNLSCRVPLMLSSMVGDKGLTESLAVTSRTVTQPGAKSPEPRGRPHARTYARAARTRQPATSRLSPRQRRMFLTITDERGTFLPNGLQLQCDPARSKKSRTTRTTLCTHTCTCSPHGTAKYFSTLFWTAQDVLTITDESGTFLPSDAEQRKAKQAIKTKQSGAMVQEDPEQAKQSKRSAKQRGAGQNSLAYDTLPS